MLELLGLEGCEEAFGRRVFPAIARAANAADDTCGLPRLAIVEAVAVVAAEGVVAEPSGRSPHTDCHAQRAEHQVAVKLF